VTSHSAAEREALADALTAAGPDAATLCEGWTAHDLAAHLIAREHRVDAGPGIMIKSMAGWTERVRLGYARQPFDELVERFRNGPSGLSWTRLPKLDALVNLTEHFVHCEDVRRGAPGWKPRDLPEARQEVFWRALRARGKLLFRKSQVGVTLQDTTGRTATVIDREPRVVVRGEPAELLMFAFGRTSAALVELEGSDEAVERLKATDLGV
jgi:uncharacterized protein (TIGR03085 family)